MKYTYFLLQPNKYTNFSEYPKESDRKATKKTTPKSGFLFAGRCFRNGNRLQTGQGYPISSR